MSVPCDHCTGVARCVNEGLMSIRASIPGRQTVQLYLCHSHQLADDNWLLILALSKLDRQPGTLPQPITPEDITINRLVQNKHTGTLSRVVTISADTIRIRTQGEQTLGFLIAELFTHYQLPGAIEEPTPTIP